MWRVLFSCPEGGGHLYPVSSAFLNAVKANTRKYYWTGRITTTAGTVYNFDQEDMVKGSGYITSQCCGSTEIELGTVYATEMGISLFSEINRYTLEDAIVELFYHLQIAGGSYETIPVVRLLWIRDSASHRFPVRAWKSGCG